MSIHIIHALLKCFLRSIKRKKFDDELVESSLVKSSTRVKGPPVMEPVRCSGSELSSGEKKKVCLTFTFIFPMWGKNEGYTTYPGVTFFIFIHLPDCQVRNYSHATYCYGNKPCTYHQKSQKKQATAAYY